MTKERVRQIQNKALVKIRSVMEDGVLRVKPRTQAEIAAEAEVQAQATATRESAD